MEFAPGNLENLLPGIFSRKPGNLSTWKSFFAWNTLQENWKSSYLEYAPGNLEILLPGIRSRKPGNP